MVADDQLPRASLIKHPQRVSNTQVLLVAILVMGLVLRLLAISTRPLWYDEAFSILFAAKGWSAMAAATLAKEGSEPHPLGYYTLLWGWMKIFGPSLPSVRVFSILPGLGTMGFTFLLVKDLFGSKTGLFATLFVGLSPFQIHYSQEIRMYSWLAFFCIGAVYALWRGMQSGRWGWWVALAVFAAAAQFTHNLAVFFLAPLFLTPVIFRDWKALRGVMLSGAGAVLLYFPWLIHLPGQFGKIRSSYWILAPSPARLISTLLAFVTNLPLPARYIPFALFASLSVVGIIAWRSFRSFRNHEAGVVKGVWLAYLGLIPPLLLFLFSQWIPVYVERALLPSGVMFLLWLAWGLSGAALPGLVKKGLLGLLLAGAVIGIRQHLTYQGFPYAPYESLGTFLAQRVDGETVVVHSNKLTMLPSYFYQPDLPQHYLADPSGSGSDTLALPTQKTLGLLADPSIEHAVGRANKVWLIIFNRAIEEYQHAGFATHPDLAWLNDHFNRIGMETWGDLLLYEYER